MYSGLVRILKFVDHYFIPDNPIFFLLVVFACLPLTVAGLSLTYQSDTPPDLALFSFNPYL
jgi:hypothetical protein